MTVKPVLAPIPQPEGSSQFPDFRPKVYNEEFYNATGGGISKMGKVIGADGLYGDGTFDKVMLKALDRVNAYRQNYEELYKQMIVDPESVEVHEITDAQAKAEMMLNVSKTILNRVVQAWRDIINSR
ncbi:MAG: flagellar hook-basal body complex protein FliE [Treponema sp.]|jgi:flagellar hook-basal body complex protein FliE|nr:flagellar hook-basal body complex protein FliE [Treponema sp.]